MTLLNYVGASLSLLPTLLALSVIYGVGLVVYRLTLHPLAKFPGPKSVAATKWVEFYYDVLKGHGGMYAGEIDKMHVKYGPIVRVTPDEIHVKDSAYYSTIYAPLPAKRDKYKPAAEMDGVPLGTFGTVEHETHRKRRAANSVYFSKKAMITAQVVVYKQVAILCENLQRAYENKAIIRCHKTYLGFTTDSTVSYLFAKCPGYQTNEEEAERWDQTTAALNRVTPLVKQYTWLPNFCLGLPGWLLDSVAPPLARLADMIKMCHAEATAYREGHVLNPEKVESSILPQTIFHAIDSSNVPDEEKTVPRLAQEGFTLLAAGADTASRVLARLTYDLITHPEILARFRKDLATAMPDGNTAPGLKDLEALPYFRACIKEELRIMALITSRLPLVAHEPLPYKDSWIIPANTPVSMTIRDVSMDPEIFPEPSTFNPDRWLEDGQLHRHLDQYFVAFGKGSRMCQGMDFGFTMLYLAASQIFTKFDLELHDTIRERDIDVKRDYFFGEPSYGSKGIQVKVVGLRA